jgi:hypothetical protein
MQHPRPRDVALPASLPHPLADAFAVLGLDPAADAGLQELALRHHLDRCVQDLPDGPERRSRLDSLRRAWTALSDPDAPGMPTSHERSADPYRVLRVHLHADQALITIAYRWLLRCAAERGDAAGFQALECAYAQVGTAAARARYDAEAAAHPVSSQASNRAVLPGIAVALAGVQRGVSQRMRVRTLAARRAGGRVQRGTAVAGHTPIPMSEGPEVVHPVGALRVLEGGREVMTLHLQDHASYTIGAGPGSAIRLPGAEREHARLTAGQGWVLFQQLADHAVSLVNGARAVRALLGPGDHLDIGPYRCQYVVARYEARGWGA